MKHPEDQPKRHVFVCYSRRDSETVDQVAVELERMGHRIWIDRTGIVGSQTWRAKIVDALRQSCAVIFFGSAESYGSRHVATELTLAEEALKPIIPVLLDDAKPEGDMAYFLARLHRIKFHGGKDYEAIAAIHAALERIEPSANGGSEVARSSRPRRVPVLVPLVASLGLAGLGYSYWGDWFDRPGGGTQQLPGSDTPAKNDEEKRAEESAARTRLEIAAAKAAEAEKLKEAQEREAWKARELQAFKDAIAAQAAKDAQTRQDAEEARLRKAAQEKEAQDKAAQDKAAKEAPRSDRTNSPGEARPSAR